MIGDLVLWCGDLSDENLTRLRRLGWLPCHGQLESKRTCHKLWDVIGARFSIPREVLPEEQFRIPDFRGRTPIGAGLGDGLTANRQLGERLGSETHTLSVAELAPHSHAMPYSSGHNSPKFPDDTPNEYGVKDIETRTKSEGEGSPHNNMQPSMVVHFLIKFDRDRTLFELADSLDDQPVR